MVRRSVFLVLLFLVNFSVVSCAAKDKPKSVKFVSETGKFSVLFPERPVEQTKDVESLIGPLNVHIFSVDQKSQAFVCMYADYPKNAVTDKNVQTVLDGVRDGNVKGIKGKLVSEKKITLGKKPYQGREVLIDFPDTKSKYRARNYLVGDRLYQVIVTGPSEFIEGETVDSYLSSFQLVE